MSHLSTSATPSSSPNLSVETNPQTPENQQPAKAEKERRCKNNGVPANALQYLNEDQVFALRQMESFGWQLAFIRRPLFQTCLVVLTNCEGTAFGVLEQDGSMNTDMDIALRH